MAEVEKYGTHVRPRFEEIFVFLRNGGNVNGLCELLNLSWAAIKRHRYKYPEFEDLIRAALSAKSDEVYSAMYQKARGYNVALKKAKVVGGEVKYVEEEQHVPASESAADMLLRNWDTDYKTSKAGVMPVKLTQVNVENLKFEIKERLESIKALEDLGVSLDEDDEG